MPAERVHVSCLGRTFPIPTFLAATLDFMLVPPCRPVLVPNLDSQLRRAIDMMYAWCLLTGFEQYEDGQPVIHFCITGGACFLWNEVLGQCWREWGRKDVQGVMIECWRHIHTRRVFGHFHQSERWELMWKSDSLDADASTPPRTFGMYTDGTLPLVTWYWPKRVDGEEAIFEEIPDQMMEGLI